MRAVWLLASAVCLSGCLDIPVPDARNCEERTAYYPDEDGDGLGEATSVYLGCEAPVGWVDNADDVPDTPPEDTGCDGDTSDTGSDCGR